MNTAPIYVDVETDGPRHIGRHVISERYDAWCDDCPGEISGVARRTAEDWIDNHHC